MLKVTYAVSKKAYTATIRSREFGTFWGKWDAFHNIKKPMQLHTLFYFLILKENRLVLNITILVYVNFSILGVMGGLSVRVIIHVRLWERFYVWPIAPVNTFSRP